MKFKIDYKHKVYNTLKYNPYLTTCMEALEADDHTAFRVYLDMALDDVKKGLEYRHIIDDGDRCLWNGIVTQYKAITALYTEFMEEYESYIDSKEKVHQNG